MTSTNGSPKDACVIEVHVHDPSQAGDLPEFNSLDDLLRWSKRFPSDVEKKVAFLRLYCEVGDLLNCFRGLQEIEGGQVTVQYTGKHLIITAPTPERLIAQFNREVR